MAFGHGKSGKIYANGFDLSAFLRQASVTVQQDTAEVTTFGASAKSFIAGLAEAMLSVAGLYDPAATGSDAPLRAAIGGDTNGNADNLWMVYPQGDTRGNPGQAMNATGTKYAINTPVGDVVDVQAEATSSVGVDNVVSLLALSTISTAAAQTSVDGGASSANGGAAYVQCSAATALTSATVKVQHSADNSTWADLATFTVTTAGTAQRVAYTGTVNRYLRANVSALTGTNLTLHVAAGRA